MDTVFISYSRRDSEFVRRVHEALKARGHDTWVDWEGIPPSDRWMATIRAAIDNAEAFLFVISPDSVTSGVCNEEIEHAVHRNKRLIPILYREPEVEVPGALAEINYVLAREKEDFKTAMDTLVEAIDTDLDWVRAHTRLLVRASEWEREGRDPSFTLRGTDLTTFEDWAAQAPNKEPKPTSLQTEYLLSSRRAVSRRQQIIGGGIAAGLVIAAVLGTAAWFQKEERDRQEEIVAARQLLSRSEGLRDAASQLPGDTRETFQALETAADALHRLHSLGEETIDADQAVRKGHTLLSKWQHAKLASYEKVREAHYSAGGQSVALLLYPLAISVWDLTTLTEHRPCDVGSESFADLAELRIADGGRRLALYHHADGNGDRPSRVRLVSVPDCKEEFIREIPANLARTPPALMMSSDGGRLGVYAGDGFHLWDVEDGARYHIPRRPRRVPYALSPDGTRVVTLDVDRSQSKPRRVYRIIRVSDSTVEEDIDHGVGIVSDPLSWMDAGLLVKGGWVDVDAGPPTYRAVKDADYDAIALSPDGRLYATLNAPVLEVRDAGTDKPVARTEVNGIDQVGFTASGDAVVATGTYTRAVSAWHFRANGPYVTIPTSSAPDHIAFDSESGALLAIGGGDVQRWRMPGPGSGDRPIPLDPLPRPDLPAPVSPQATDGRTIAGVDIGRTGLTALVIEGNPLNGTRAGPRRYVELWLGDDKKTALEVQATLDMKMYGYVRFGGNDQYLLVGAQNGIRLFNVPPPEEISVKDIEEINVSDIYHRDAVQAGVRLDGERIVTMSSDLSIRVWDVGTKLMTSQLAASRSYGALALSGDGRWLAGLARDRTIDVWALAPTDLLAQACRWLEPPCP